MSNVLENISMGGTQPDFSEGRTTFVGKESLKVSDIRDRIFACIENKETVFTLKNACINELLDFKTLDEIKHIHDMKIVIDNVDFLGGVILNGLNLHEEVHIKNTNFKSDVYLQGAKMKSVYIQNVNFDYSINVEDATFHDAVEIDSCKFKKERDFVATNAVFEGFVSVSNVQFENNSGFSKSRFKNKLLMENVTFNCTTSFANAVFEKRVTFNQLSLAQNATIEFSNTEIQNVLKLMPFELNGKVQFDSCVLEEDKSQVVFTFLNCPTDSKGEVTFKNMLQERSTLYSVQFHDLNKAHIVRIKFEDCRFYGNNVLFERIALKNIFISGGNQTLGMAFQHCNWPKTKWPKTSFIPSLESLFCQEFHSFCEDETSQDNDMGVEKIKDKINLYSHLKDNATKMADAQLANDFYFWQMKYKQQLKDCVWQKMYLDTSMFGLNFKRPLLIYFFTFILFSLLYIGVFSINHSFSGAHAPGWQALETSFNASLPPLFGQYSSLPKIIKSTEIYPQAYIACGFLYMLYTSQHIIQGFLLFQAVSAIRGRVKR
jgi:hypothetical protein